MPNPGRVERRATALRRLSSLQTELERIRVFAAPGEDVLIWPGYRDALHDLVAALGEAGEDVTPFGPGGEAEISRTPFSRGDEQRISLDDLRTDVRRVRERVDARSQDATRDA